ncbi:hypothetical protein ACH5RR_009173 [Cinchona calisaya]|uniref:Uncharacterized protein n=1 Tax=Cinchona calisaya TaxID=153742 RepID=A0ABD3ADJ9_9GENT
MERVSDDNTANFLTKDSNDNDSHSYSNIDQVDRPVVDRATQLKEWTTTSQELSTKLHAKPAKKITFVVCKRTRKRKKYVAGLSIMTRAASRTFTLLPPQMFHNVPN